MPRTTRIEDPPARTGASRGASQGRGAPPERPPDLLAGWPGVCAELTARAVPLRPLAGESREEREDRLGTALMALYRDTRSGESFEALYALARPPVLAWIRALTARRSGGHDPLELLQDTFVNVYRYPSGFRDERHRSFRVWVRTIAGNVIRRKGGTRPRISFQELPHGLHEPVDLRGGPVLQTLGIEERRRLRSAWVLFLAHYREAWSGLGQRDRRALHLVEVEGLPYEEAGRLLGVRRSNMKMIVFRARKRIARRMRAAMELSAA